MRTYNMDYTHENTHTCNAIRLYHTLVDCILTINGVLSGSKIPNNHKDAIGCELISDKILENTDDTNLEDDDNDSRMLVVLEKSEEYFPLRLFLLGHHKQPGDHDICCDCLNRCSLA